jgi:hypothetical protein
VEKQAVVLAEASLRNCDLEAPTVETKTKRFN